MLYAVISIRDDLLLLLGMWSYSCLDPLALLAPCLVLSYSFCVEDNDIVRFSHFLIIASRILAANFSAVMLWRSLSALVLRLQQKTAFEVGVQSDWLITLVRRL